VLDEQRATAAEPEDFDTPFLHSTIERGPNGATMTLSGELDLAAVPELNREVASIIAKDETPDLLIDLALVTFLDSSGLAFLVSAHKRLLNAGAQLTIVGATPQIRRLFEITGLTEVFDIAR
jgi:anti-sigma B factor antagonist